MNAYLKEIAACCGIKLNLTFHRTAYFRYDYNISNGVTTDSISKMLGHSNLTPTQLYAITLDLKVGNDMTQLKKR